MTVVRKTALYAFSFVMVCVAVLTLRGGIASPADGGQEDRMLVCWNGHGSPIPQDRVTQPVCPPCWYPAPPPTTVEAGKADPCLLPPATAPPPTTVGFAISSATVFVRPVVVVPPGFTG